MTGRRDDQENNGRLQPTPLWMIGALFLVSAVTTFFLTDIWLRTGRAPVVIPSGLSLVPLAIGVVMLWQGWGVRNYRERKRALSPLHAARVWLLSQAVSRAGAIISGVSAGVGVGYAYTSTSAVMMEQIWHIGSAGVASLAMTGAALLAENWCRTDDDDPAAEAGASTA
ncbi:MAG: DUF3180 domain-containing protein [Actinomycetaceae bacterium]|nr:DUF3180 domain-containing protein [Actinomycetaceae bacterium]